LKGFRNFNNKLWNASKFVLNVASTKSNPTPKAKHVDDIAMLTHLGALREKYIKLMSDYKFWIISEELYLSFWNEFCDKYIESVKSRIGEFKDGAYIREESPEADAARATINYALKQYLKMLHPFIPHITGRIWREVQKDPTEHKDLMFTII
jgi:valyl-tRNA synthetase